MNPINGISPRTALTAAYKADFKNPTPESRTYLTQKCNDFLKSPEGKRLNNFYEQNNKSNTRLYRLFQNF